MKIENLEYGILETPEDILSEFPETFRFTLDNIFQTIWSNFLLEKKTCTLTQLEKLGEQNNVVFNRFIKKLADNGWIISHIEANYGYLDINENMLLQFIDKETLQEVKFANRFVKYRMRDSVSRLSDKAKFQNEVYEAMFKRDGFMKAGNHTFKYDIDMLEKYIYTIADNVLKGMDTETTKDVSYEEVCCELIGYYIGEDNTYTMENNISDSRGRAIHQCTRRILNPIASKDARALMKVKPRPLTEAGEYQVYLAIAELLDYDAENNVDKAIYGRKAYEHKTQYKLNLSKQEDKDILHKQILLERIYAALDTNTDEWDIPIEVDATASMLQVIGVLTGYIPYLEKTNLLGKDLSDIWSVKGVPRTHVKKAMTPILYGSSATIKQLWDDNKLKYTQKQLNIMKEELDNGIFKLAKEFKEFIINNVEPKPESIAVIWKEFVGVRCNRFKPEHTTITHYPVYTSSQKVVKRLKRAMSKTPDLQSFKRYFVTLLIHNLDSQVANQICEKIDEVFPVHDAFISHPDVTIDIKLMYVKIMERMFQEREEILKAYFKSIGINGYFFISNEQISDKERLTFSTNALK